MIATLLSASSKPKKFLLTTTPGGRASPMREPGGYADSAADAGAAPSARTASARTRTSRRERNGAMGRSYADRSAENTADAGRRSQCRDRGALRPQRAPTQLSQVGLTFRRKIGK